MTYIYTPYVDDIYNAPFVQIENSIGYCGLNYLLIPITLLLKFYFLFSFSFNCTRQVTLLTIAMSGKHVVNNYGQSLISPV